jgi:hypothetical protein
LALEWVVGLALLAGGLELFLGHVVERVGHVFDREGGLRRKLMGEWYLIQ